MATKIKNTETNEITTITVIDPKSGCDWSGDLIGNADDLAFASDDDDFDFEGTSDQISWWVEYCDKYDRLDSQLHALLQNADTDDAEHVHNMLCDNDFNGIPDALEAAIEYITNK